MLNLKEALAEDILAGLIAAKLIKKSDKIFKDDKNWLPPVDRSTDPEHGDYASPVALSLAKKLKKKPMDLVAAIVEHMPKKKYAGKLEAVEPGFLNIRLNPGWLTSRLDDLVEDDLCKDIKVGDGKAVNIEFISANPTGPMTLGNLRNGFVADTLANIMTCAGYNVTREFYINDAGNQVKKLGESVIRRSLQAAGEKIEFPEDLYQGEYIKQVAATIAERLRENDGQELEPADLEDSEVIDKISREAVDILQAANRKTVEEILKIKFDVWASEQKLRDSGMVEKTVAKLDKKKTTFKKDGAKWLKTTKFGDTKDEVLIKKDGEYAYFSPDIAYNLDKANRGYDLIFTFLGADHLAHVPKMKAAMAALGEDVNRWEYHICQMFRMVKDGKPVRLSKRKGEIITPQDLISEVGYDAARFFFLRHSLGSHMDFDLDLASEQSERNPVYYIQYAFVRLQSILRRAKQEGIIESIGDDVALTSNARLTHTAEIRLLKEIFKWPEMVSEVAVSREPHQLTYYAADLAKAIHFFYKHVPVISADDGEIQRGRLQLVLGARKVLGQTLDLLGISKPDVM